MATAYTDQVQKVYIAYYGRAADPVGLKYWAAKVETDGLAGIMASFGASAEATTLYGSLTNTAMVNALYKQSFGRDADFAGLMHYAGELTAGTMTAATIAQNIFDGATGTDATILANKLIVAKAYTTAVDTASEVVAYSGTVAATSARALLTTIDATTVTTGFDVATSIASIVSTSNSTGNIAGSSFVLTPSTDVAGKTSATNGTLSSTFRFTDVANETVTGDIGTIQAADILLDGSSTDQDVLNLTLSGTLGAFTSNRIENINAEFAAGVPILDLTNITNTTAYSVTGAVAGSIVELAMASKAAPITLKDFTKVLTVNMEQLSGTTALSTGETLDVTLTGALKSSAAIASGVTLTADTATGLLEVMNVTSSGTVANEYTLNAGTNVTLGTVNLLGATELTTHMSHADATGITIDGSAATGVQNLVLDRTGATTTATNTNLFSGLDLISVKDSVSPGVGGDGADLSGLKSGQSISLLDDFNSATLAFSAVTGSADSATITLDNETALTDLDVTQIDIQNVETLNIVSNGFSTSSATAAENLINDLVGDATTITVSGDTSLNLDLNIDAPTTGSRSVTVNASTNTAFVDMVASANSKVSYTLTGGVGKDTLTLNDSGGTLAGGLGADTLTGGAGADTISTGGGATNSVFASAGTDAITLGAGVDTITFGEADVTAVAQVSIHTAALVWTAADTIVVTVGTTAKTYTVTALDVAGTASADLALVEESVVNFFNGNFTGVSAVGAGGATAIVVTADAAATGADQTPIVSMAIVTAGNGTLAQTVGTAGVDKVAVATTITGFSTGTVDDIIAIDLSEMNAVAAFDNLVDSSDNLADTDDVEFINYTMSTTLAATGIAATANLVKVAFSNSINSATNLIAGMANGFTLDANTGSNTDQLMLAFYDADDAVMRFGLMADTDADSGAEYDDTNNSFIEITAVGMTSTEYTALTTGNFDIVA